LTTGQFGPATWEENTQNFLHNYSNSFVGMNAAVFPGLGEEHTEAGFFIKKKCESVDKVT
jgi:hypothetical protein